LNFINTIHPAPPTSLFSNKFRHSRLPSTSLLDQNEAHHKFHGSSHPPHHHSRSTHQNRRPRHTINMDHYRLRDLQYVSRQNLLIFLLTQSRQHRQPILKIQLQYRRQHRLLNRLLHRKRVPNGHLPRRAMRGARRQRTNWQQHEPVLDQLVL
jgi:hypothetical protein